MPSKNKFTTEVAAAVCAIMFLVSPVAAAQVDLSNAAFAQIAGLTSIPIGHSEFCKQNRSECGAYDRVVEVEELTQDRWNGLVAINDRLNRDIIPVTDQDLYRVEEFWTYPNGYGDCEDYALAKRRELMGEGWKASALMVAVVRQKNGDGHAVLMVRTDRGDLILDNLDGMVRVWTDTPYQYIKRQSQENAGQWVDILDNRTLIIAQK